MIKFCALAGSLLAACSTAHAATYTVTSASQLQSTLGQLAAGDTMYIAPGDYYPTIAQNPYNHLLMENKNGNANAWITIRNQPGQARPRIFLGGNLPNGFTIRNSSYVRIEGLEIVGGNANDTGTNGIYSSDMHHYQIVNCVVRDMGASGISVNSSSQVLIENNTVYGNSKKAAYGSSGISLYHPLLKTTDNSNFAGTLGNPDNNNYAIIVRNNTCYDNIELVNDASYNAIIDGNGIIIDDFNGSQTGGVYFNAKTLVANNVCYYNGARGIHIFDSSNTDVFNNTVYKNQRNLGGGEISSWGSNNRFYNNIVVAENKEGTKNGSGTGSSWENNLYFNVSAKVNGLNDKTGDPKFYAPGTNGNADFRLQSTSPAINSGRSVSLGFDRELKSRVGTIDIGAYEFASLASNPSFEAEQYSTQTPSGWSTWAGSAGTDGNADYTEAGGSSTPHSGNYNAAHWKASNYEVYTFQTKTGLTNGLYTLRAWVRSSGGQTNRAGGKAILLAKNFGGTEKNINLVNVGTGWTLVTISDINVTNGQCEIGFYSYAAGGTWIAFDDVEFFKQY